MHNPGPHQWDENEWYNTSTVFGISVDIDIDIDIDEIRWV